MAIVASRGMDQYPVRFPDGMREEIKVAAALNGRSMNSEILERLSSSSIGGGKTLRDEIAMAAMNGFIASLAHPDSGGPPNRYSSDIAEYSYSLADAMLAERQKGGA